MAENAPTATRSAAPPESTPPKPPGEKHDIWIWVVLALVVIGVVIGYLIYEHDKKPPAKVPPPVNISTTNAVKGEIDEAVVALGTVTPIYTAMISPRVDGTLVKVNYTEGQMVTTNDLLAEIDTAPYKALLTESEGQFIFSRMMPANCLK